MITLPVEKDGDDYIVTFTDDLLEQLGWNTGDTLNWEPQVNGSIIVTKVDSDEQSVKKPTYTAYRSVNPLHDC